MSSLPENNPNNTLLTECQAPDAKALLTDLREGETCTKGCSEQFRFRKVKEGKLMCMAHVGLGRKLKHCDFRAKPMKGKQARTDHH